MRQQALDWILAAAQRPDPALEPEFDIADDERREAKKVRNLHRHDPLFWDDWFARSGLDALVRDHLRKPRLLRHAAFIKRHADESYIPLHQDIALWEKRYESAQTFWVALTPSRNDNGGMFYYPDDRTIFPHEFDLAYPMFKCIDLQANGISREQLVDAELDAGDVLVWPARTAHGSHNNRSGELRIGMPIVFVEDDEFHQLNREDSMKTWIASNLKSVFPDEAITEDNLDHYLPQLCDYSLKMVTFLARFSRQFGHAPKIHDFIRSRGWRRCRPRTRERDDDPGHRLHPARGVPGPPVQLRQRAVGPAGTGNRGAGGGYDRVRPPADFRGRTRAGTRRGGGGFHAGAGPRPGAPGGYRRGAGNRCAVGRAVRLDQRDLAGNQVQGHEPRGGARTVPRRDPLRRERGLRVRATVEDAARTSVSDLVSMIATARDAGADRICFADSVGILLPDETFDVLSLLRHEFPDVVFEYHVHNDRGLALGNTLAAIQAGVQWHSASCNGIGERAGITDTFQLLTLLHTKFAADRFNLKNVLAVSELVEAHSRIKRSPMHPVVGENAFVHVARLHQLAMQENQDAYSAFDPELINGRVSLQRYTPMHRQSLFLTPFEKSASELKYHRHGPGKRFVMLDRRLLDGSPFYFIARQFHDVGDGGPGHVDSHVHNCDSVFLFLGSDEDYRGLEVEVLLGGQLRRLQSPASVFIPAGVEHSYRYLGGSGTYINFVHKGDYHESLLEITQ